MIREFREPPAGARRFPGTSELTPEQHAEGRLFRQVGIAGSSVTVWECALYGVNESGTAQGLLALRLLRETQSFFTSCGT